jgi:hypothetical protein
MNENKRLKGWHINFKKKKTRNGKLVETNEYMSGGVFILNELLVGKMKASELNLQQFILKNDQSLKRKLMKEDQWEWT